MQLWMSTFFLFLFPFPISFKMFLDDAFNMSEYEMPIGRAISYYSLKNGSWIGPGLFMNRQYYICSI